MTAPLHLVRSFGPNELLAVEYRGQPVLLAGQLGAALGYADPKKLANNISQKWADEFAVGRDYFKLDGVDLMAFKAVMSSWSPDRAPAVHPATPQLLLLTERGAYLAAALSRTPVGAAFRAWVVDDLLPAWRAAQEAAAPPPVPPGPSRLEQARAMRLQAEETERLALEQLAEADQLLDQAKAESLPLDVAREIRALAETCGRFGMPRIARLHLLEASDILHDLAKPYTRRPAPALTVAHQPTWRDIRRSLGLTQAEVAAQVGIKQAQLSGIECARRQPSFGVLRELARFYGLTEEQVGQLVGA